MQLNETMEDQWMHDCLTLIVYIERDIVDSIDNEIIMQQF